MTAFFIKRNLDVVRLNLTIDFSVSLWYNIYVKRKTKSNVILVDSVV